MFVLSALKKVLSMSGSFPRASSDKVSHVICANSTSKIITFDYTWTINNFSFDLPETIRSANFGPQRNDNADDDQPQFYLKLYPRGSENHDYVSVYLKLSSANSVKVFYKLSIIDRKGQSRNIKGNGQVRSFARGGLGWGWDEFINQNKLNQNKGFLKDGNLIIHCEIILIPTASALNKDLVLFTQMDCIDNFANWLDDEMLSDVMLLVGGRKQLPAHKFILATRSPVFATMFEQQNELTQVPLTDMEVEVMEKLLEYIYTGKVSSIEDFASKLLPLADKFKVNHLKSLCERTLSTQMTTETVLDLMHLSELHNLNHLKEKSLDYIREDILNFIASNNDILVETFRKLVLNEDVPNNICNCKTVSFSHIWMIENFSQLCHDSIDNRRPIIRSCTFGVPRSDQIQMHLELRPRGSIRFINKWLALYLNLVSSNVDKGVSVQYTFSILDSQGNKYNTKSNKSILKSASEYSWGWAAFVNRFDLLNRAKELLPNNTLTILCEMKVISHLKTSNSVHHNVVTNGDIPNNYGNWLDKGNLSDVVLVTAGRELRAHKVILSIRSPVFAEMFKYEMKENKENRVDLTGVKFDVAQLFLQFIYTGKLSSIGPQATDLLILADKFQVDSLKTLCEQCLAGQLCHESVLDLLKLAELYDANGLKESALEYIRKPTFDAIETITDQHLLISVFRQLFSIDN